MLIAWASLSLADTFMLSKLVSQFYSGEAATACSRLRKLADR